ncbi:hypothetical protein BN1013_02121 [Candidatus Rubidus massiliensis]|nr:hypothetical protein BN1013_02121 [Candidatus Rubidus massiliensis]
MFSIQNGSSSEILNCIADQLDSLVLPIGKTITKTQFCEDSLFIHTLEKQNVFVQLQKFICSNTFAKDYQTFLTDIKTDYWFTRYETNPHQLAYLALIAFFCEAIDQEELFIANIVSYGFYEKISTTNLVNLNVGLLNNTNAAIFLCNSNFPLFAKEGAVTLLTNFKSIEDLKNEQAKFINDLSLLSPLKRTYVEYTLTPFTKDESSPFGRRYSLLEQALYLDNNCNIGIKDVSDNLGTIVLLSPYLSITLAKNATANLCRNFRDHHYMFGFSKNDDPLFKGIRIISIPSPLFYVPYIEECMKGSPGFQVYHHDINYHIILDMNNPHIDIFCHLAATVQSLAAIENNPILKQFFLELAFNIVDREAHEYTFLPSEKAFITFLNKAYSFLIEVHTARFINECMVKSKIFEFPPLNSFSNWLWNILTDEEKVRLKISCEESINESLR